MTRLRTGPPGISLPVEAQLLLACSHATTNPDLERRIIALLREPLDWDRLVDLAYQNAVTPLLYSHLRHLAADGIPTDVFDRLASFYRENGRRNLILSAELLRLLALFESCGISAIAYKGPVLAIMYGDLALREFDDLDILLRPSDMRVARALVLECGYRSHIELSATQDAAYLRSHHALGFVSADGRVDIELHHRIRPEFFGFPLDTQEVWARSQMVRMGGRELRSLSKTDLLLILSAHGTAHCWDRLSWICDIAELVRRDKDVDWENLHRTARILGSGRMLRLALILARDLLGASVPPRVEEQIDRDRIGADLARQVSRSLFGEASEGLHGMRRILFQLRARERSRDRWRYCVLLIITPNERDWQMVELPGLFTFLYYLLRPLRVSAGFLARYLRHGLGRE